MTRMETEKAILEHLIAISNLYADYDSSADYLHICINNNHINGNGNDYGDWDTRDISVFSSKEADKEIKFRAWIDIDNQKYQDAMAKYNEKYQDLSDEDITPKWEYAKGVFVCLGEKDYD